MLDVPNFNFGRKKNFGRSFPEKKRFFKGIQGLLAKITVNPTYCKYNLQGIVCILGK